MGLHKGGKGLGPLNGEFWPWAKEGPLLLLLPLCAAAARPALLCRAATAIPPCTASAHSHQLPQLISLGLFHCRHVHSPGWLCILQPFGLGALLFSAAAAAAPSGIGGAFFPRGWVQCIRIQFAAAGALASPCLALLLLHLLLLLLLEPVKVLLLLEHLLEPRVLPVLKALRFPQQLLNGGWAHAAAGGVDHL